MNCFTCETGKRMLTKRLILIFVLLSTSLFCFSQTGDSSKVIHHFSGAASITNNGISFVPSFSLGRPATILLMSLGGERFSIDPDIRFALDGKPWTFLFWARYKLFTEGRFRMHTGAHLGLNFRTNLLSVQGTATENIVVRRYLAGELAPNYFVAKNISIGTYYLYSRGIDEGAVKNTIFITLNSNFSHIPITQQFFLRLNPQFFYLNQDGKTGHYFTSVLTLAKNKFPLSFSSVINKAIRTNIPGKDFLWSLSLVYSFNRNYVPRQPVL